MKDLGPSITKNIWIPLTITLRIFQAQYLGPSGSITEDPVCPQARELAPIYVHLVSEKII